jgi:hypothetical protein
MNQSTLNATIANELIQRFENPNTLQYDSLDFYCYLYDGAY